MNYHKLKIIHHPRPLSLSNRTLICFHSTSTRHARANGSQILEKALQFFRTAYTSSKILRTLLFGEKTLHFVDNFK